MLLTAAMLASLLIGVTRQRAELSQISIFCYFYAVSKKSRDTCSSL